MDDVILVNYTISNDPYINLLKAESVLKNSLDQMSQGRLALCKNNKTNICDKDYVCLLKNNL
jgi:hypothetical protein